jgi:hemerythrin-like domain-containing protein
MGLELGSQSWPPDLLFLLERFPRRGWPDHPALGDLAEFWLHKHASLRRLGAGLTQAGADLREGRVEPLAFRSGFVPPLQAFLEALESHHQVEDQHYFPLFRSIEPRLAAGFEILERDHGVLHQQIIAVVELARTLARTDGSDRAVLRSAAEDYITATDILTGLLPVHLSDEEDLVIPLLASRSG